MLVHKECDSLIKLKIQSRHSRSSQRTLWIEFSDKITGWYCTCKVGARVIGCCAHVASVLWYLGYDRHEDSHVSGVEIDTDNIEDAKFIPISDDLDSDENEAMEE